jgi:hypothetical protein
MCEQVAILLHLPSDATFGWKAHGLRQALGRQQSSSALAVGNATGGQERRCTGRGNQNTWNSDVSPLRVAQQTKALIIRVCHVLP